jgi:hypothetical protein
VTDADFDKRLLTARIITFALIQGAVLYLAIAVYARGQNLVPPRDEPLTSYVAVPFTAAALAAYVIVPRFVEAGWRRQALGRLQPGGERVEQEPAALFAAYQTLLLVRLALLESAVFLNLTAYLVDETAWTLAQAVLLVVGMCLHFPTRSRILAWGEAQVERVRQARRERI